jgi:hypothetical protein
MNIPTVSPQLSIGTDTSNAPRASHTRRLGGSRVALRNLVIAVVAVFSSLGIMTAVAPHADAAYANQWVYFQTDSDGYYDMAIWYGANGRPVANSAHPAWFDFNNDNRLESLARDVTGDGVIDEIWLDHQAPGGGWDYFLVGNIVWQGQNQTGRYGEYYTDQYGLNWRNYGFSSTTIGGNPSSGTSMGAYYNLMVSLARQSGVAV